MGERESASVKSGFVVGGGGRVGPQPGSGVCKGRGVGGALLAGGGGAGCFAVVCAFGEFRLGSESLSEGIRVGKATGVGLREFVASLFQLGPRLVPQ